MKWQARYKTITGGGAIGEIGSYKTANDDILKKMNNVKVTAFGSDLVDVRDLKFESRWFTDDNDIFYYTAMIKED